jgi:hypothetical protein
MSHNWTVAENLGRVVDAALPIPLQLKGTALQQWVSVFAQLSQSQNQGAATLTPKILTGPNITAGLESSL